MLKSLFLIELIDIMKGIFPEGNELKKVIESYDWTLYDVSNPPEGRAFTWEELDKKSPVKQFEIDHQYLFVPIPKKGQTVREAYISTKGLGPSLMIENPDDERYVSLIVKAKSKLDCKRGCVALFSRLVFDERFAYVTSPETDYLPDPDLVAIKYDKLVDTFRRYFRVILPEEYGIKTPVPMPSSKRKSYS
jgi:hypothetical protein